jgi:hypothetical protein
MYAIKSINKLAPHLNELYERKTRRTLLETLLGIRKKPQLPPTYAALLDKQADYTINPRRALAPMVEPILGDYLGLRGGDMLGPFPPAKPWSDADITGQMSRLVAEQIRELGHEKKSLAFCDLTEEEAAELAEEQKRQYIEAGMDPDEIERNQYADLIG